MGDVGVEENLFLRILIQGTRNDISNCEVFNESLLFESPVW